MPVIKPSEIAIAPSAFSMKDIERQAQMLMLRARQRAESLLIEAQQTAELLRAEAHADGFKQGHEEGMGKGLEQGAAAGKQQALAEHNAKLTQATTALSAAAAQIESAKQDLLGDGLRDVIELATAIARRVTRRQAGIDPAVLTETVRDALRLTVHCSDIHIVLNPAQRQLLLDELPELQRHYSNLQHVQLVDDATVEPGGCRLLTRHGEVNAEIGMQLDRVIAELMPEAST